MGRYETLGNIEAYNDLAQAIIMLACNDYRKYADHLSITKNEYNEKILSEKILDIEKFLKSQYGMMLSHDLGHAILRILKQELKDKPQISENEIINKYKRKLTEDDVINIRKEFILNDKKFGAIGLAKKYGVTSNHIYDIVRKRKWKNVE